MSSSRYDPYSSRRDSDRDRDRDRRPPLSTRDERERASMGYMSRETQDLHLPDSKMDLVKFGPELASLHRQLWDCMAERGRLSTKRENEQKLWRRREQDYKNLSGITQFSSVEEPFQRHKETHKKALEVIERDLAKVENTIKSITDNYTDRVVKAVPLSEIKTRQIIEIVRKEASSQPRPIASDDRFEKLEQQLAVLIKTQELQAEDLAQVKKENDLLRTRNATYEERATELATLKTQCEQIKGQVESQKTEHKKDELAGEMLTLRKNLGSLREQIESQIKELRVYLEEVKSQHSQAIATSTASMQDLVALKGRVDEHDNQLSSFDATEHTNAMEKLLDYPSWADLSSLLEGQESIARLAQSQLASTASTSKLQTDVEKRFKTLEQASQTQFHQFSTIIVERCASMVDGVRAKTTHIEEKLTALDARVPSTSRTASVGLANGSSSQAISGDGANETALVAKLEEDLAALREEFRSAVTDIGDLRKQSLDTGEAHELMIHTLDSQFKNITTGETAQIIMEQIRRLPQSTISLDVQNLHERLATLEEAARGESSLYAFDNKVLRDIGSDLRSNLRQMSPQKRRRINRIESNGTVTNHAGE